ncbi:cation:proton antiporter [Candidatus Uhrbacteria bacterium]|nr:cation:proton antiporter [Candidatus Uhrbacteria bacterium]MBD3284466.1 cation:proton antiporter [Candidatus Uhrbacteria bacterium]
MKSIFTRNWRRTVKATLTVIALSLFVPSLALASHGSGEEGGHGSHFALVLAFLGVIVVLAKVAGSIAERFKQVSVLGELLLGIALGIPVLFGWHFFDGFKENELVLFISELAVIVLLFQAGLESNLHEMKRVGMKAFIVAIVGVIVPFVLGTYVLAPWLFPEGTSNFALFLGATLTATSVGITARVFKDLKISQTKSAKIVLGAAVFDDIMGLIILAVVNGIVQSGHVGPGEIAWISFKAVAFLVVSIFVGRLLAPHIGRFLSRISSGVSMKMALALAFAFGYAYLGSQFGLAPIVGAFAAGLLLDSVYFSRFVHPKLTNEIEKIVEGCQDARVSSEVQETLKEHRHRHIEDLIEDFGHWFIPVFFVVTGMAVNLSVLADMKVLLAALALTVAAVLGKIVSGFFAGKGADWKVVGLGMVPRGEVGLIFAAIGRQSGVINDEAFAIIVVMIILTTFITPIVLPRVIKKSVEEKPVETPVV